MRRLLGIAFLVVLSVPAFIVARTGTSLPRSVPGRTAQAKHLRTPAPAADVAAGRIVAEATAGHSDSVDAPLPRKSAADGWRTLLRAMSGASARNLDDVDSGNVIVDYQVALEARVEAPEIYGGHLKAFCTVALEHGGHPLTPAQSDLLDQIVSSSLPAFSALRTCPFPRRALLELEAEQQLFLAMYSVLEDRQTESLVDSPLSLHIASGSRRTATLAREDAPDEVLATWTRMYASPASSPEDLRDCVRSYLALLDGVTRLDARQDDILEKPLSPLAFNLRLASLQAQVQTLDEAARRNPEGFFRLQMLPPVEFHLLRPAP